MYNLGKSLLFQPSSSSSSLMLKFIGRVFQAARVSVLNRWGLEDTYLQPGVLGNSTKEQGTEVVIWLVRYRHPFQEVLSPMLGALREGC